MKERKAGIEIMMRRPEEFLEFVSVSKETNEIFTYIFLLNEAVISVPDPPDPHVFGPPGSGSGSISQMYGSGSCSGSGSFYHHAKIVRKTLIPTIL
jgi:hypothetical protein